MSASFPRDLMPGVRRRSVPVAILAVGVLLAVLSFAVRPKEKSRPMQARTLASFETTGEIGEVPPAETERGSAVPSSAPRAVVSPREAETDPERLRGWLLTLPDEQFGKLVGTPKLDSYVVQILSWIHRSPEARNGPPREAGEFLHALNERILTVRARR